MAKLASRGRVFPLPISSLAHVHTASINTKSRQKLWWYRATEVAVSAMVEYVHLYNHEHRRCFSQRLYLHMRLMPVIRCSVLH